MCERLPPHWRRCEQADRTSDEALTRMCLHGLGPHRLERTDRGYVVKTNALASFDVAEGFERYGGDVHLDEQFRPVRIVRLEKSEGGRGGLVEVEYLPGCEGWEYVKFCFRCSLFTLATTAWSTLHGSPAGLCTPPAVK